MFTLKVRCRRPFRYAHAMALGFIGERVLSQNGVWEKSPSWSGCLSAALSSGMTDSYAHLRNESYMAK